MSASTLVAMLRHFEDRAATCVLLRAEQAPVFWKGSALLDDQGGFAQLSSTDVRKAIHVPLDDAQLAQFRRRNFVSVELRIKKYGAYQFEAYVMGGHEEVTIASADRVHDRIVAPDADEYWNLGVGFIEQGEYQLAWHAFEKALALAPNDGAIMFEIGKLLGFDLHRVDEAIAILERVPDASADVLEALAVLRGA